MHSNHELAKTEELWMLFALQTPLLEQKHLWNAVYICGSEQVSEYLIWMLTQYCRDLHVLNLAVLNIRNTVLATVSL